MPSSASQGARKTTRSAAIRGTTRIQREKTEQILDAALEVFSSYGFRGTTIDQIATQAGLSKPNVLYYFDTKEAIYQRLLTRLLETWLAPLHEVTADGDPIEVLMAYVYAKLDMARDFPRESRLFANEVLEGAPLIIEELSGPLQVLLDEKAEIIRTWTAEGRLAQVDPHHLIFSIWATTQHYADFDVQVRAVLGDRSPDRFEAARTHLDAMFRGLLAPKP